MKKVMLLIFFNTLYILSSQTIIYPYNKLDFTYDNMTVLRKKSNDSILIKSDKYNLRKAKLAYTDKNNSKSTATKFSGLDDNGNKVEINFSDIIEVKINNKIKKGLFFRSYIESINITIVYLNIEKDDLVNLSEITYDNLLRNYYKVISINILNKSEDGLLTVISEKSENILFQEFNENEILYFYFDFWDEIEETPIWWASETIANSDMYPYKLNACFE